MSKELEEKQNKPFDKSIDSYVPYDHPLKLINELIYFDFVYDLVDDAFLTNEHALEIDPVVLIKTLFIKDYYEYKSIREVVDACNANQVYRWFLGFEIDEKIPNYIIFGKCYYRYFDNELICDIIFDTIIRQALDYDLISVDELENKFSSRDEIDSLLLSLDDSNV